MDSNWSFLHDTVESAEKTRMSLVLCRSHDELLLSILESAPVGQCHRICQKASSITTNFAPFSYIMALRQS